jgi:hypothetical protein
LPSASAMLCRAFQETHRPDPRWTREDVIRLSRFSLLDECRPKAIITQVPSTFGACETHAQTGKEVYCQSSPSALLTVSILLYFTLFARCSCLLARQPV